MRGGVPALTSAVGVGLGQQLPFIGTPPAAGANFIFACDGRARRLFKSLVFNVSLANAGANRLVTVEYRGKDALPFSVNEATTLQVINTSERYSGSIAYTVSDFNTGTDLMFPLDPVYLEPGDTLNIIIAGIDAGDTITNIRGVLDYFPLDRAWLPMQEP